MASSAIGLQVNLHHAIDCRALCGASLVRCYADSWGNETRVAHRVDFDQISGRKFRRGPWRGGETCPNRRYSSRATTRKRVFSYQALVSSTFILTHFCWRDLKGHDSPKRGLSRNKTLQNRRFEGQNTSKHALSGDKIP